MRDPDSSDILVTVYEEVIILWTYHLYEKGKNKHIKKVDDINSNIALLCQAVQSQSCENQLMNYSRES